MATTKTCTKCGGTKALDEFHRDKRSKTGHVSRCRDCALEYARTYRESAPDCSIQRADYYQRNRDFLKVKSRAYRKANPDRQREHRAKHPESRWASVYRDRARKYGFEPVVESFTRADLVAAYGDACAHCGGIFEELDHYPVPVAHGGSHTLSNVRPSCTACNRSQARAIQLAASR